MRELTGEFRFIPGEATLKTDLNPKLVGNSLVMSPNGQSIDWSLSPNTQSGVVFIDNESLLIVRPLRDNINKSTGFTREEELKRRKDAVELHTKTVPQFTLRNEVSEEYWVDADGRIVPVIARKTERYYGVRNISQIPMAELLRDTQLCLSLSEIYEVHLKLTNAGFHYDVTSFGNFGKSWNQVTRLAFRPYQSSNIMVGYSYRGVRRVFCDPDWYLTTEEYLKRSKGKVKTASVATRRIHLAKSAAFYKAAAFMYQDLTTI